MITIPRRRFLTGFAGASAFLVAPTIVRTGILMPVKPLPNEDYYDALERIRRSMEPYGPAEAVRKRICRKIAPFLTVDIDTGAYRDAVILDGGRLRPGVAFRRRRFS